MTPHDRDAVLFPPKGGGNGNRSFHCSSGNMGTGREQREQTVTFPQAEQFRAMGTDKPKRDHFMRPEKNEEFPTSGTDKRAEKPPETSITKGSQYRQKTRSHTGHNIHFGNGLPYGENQGSAAGGFRLTFRLRQYAKTSTWG